MHADAKPERPQIFINSQGISLDDVMVCGSSWAPDMSSDATMKPQSKDALTVISSSFLSCAALNASENKQPVEEIVQSCLITALRFKAKQKRQLFFYSVMF